MPRRFAPVAVIRHAALTLLLYAALLPASRADDGSHAHAHAASTTAGSADESALQAVPAQVVLDPRRTVLLTARQAGQLETGAVPLPQAGQTVVAGQVLARLRPLMSQPERRTVEGELATAKRDVAMGYLQIDRYGIKEQEFDVKLPTPTLQILTDYRAAQGREQQLAATLDSPLTIVAPRAGTVVRVAASSGRVIEPGETLFELQASDGLAIEARYADEHLDAPDAATAIDGHGQRLALRRIATGFDPADRRHRALYAAVDPHVNLQPNQRLRVLLPRRTPTSTAAAATR